ncbi:hypothetical protein [Flammeovirga pectinis]|uniref:hypothetical protein n=1 Tax=Flammeovirga pectinis TaxID=2494373 RepID=UPI0012D83885|nr:hypothetical protein [Flammeovirga pectinis]
MRGFLSSGNDYPSIKFDKPKLGDKVIDMIDGMEIEQRANNIFSMMENYLGKH